MVIELKGNRIEIILDKDLYNSDVLHKCFYWYGGDFQVEISVYSELHYLIILTPKKNTFDFSTIQEKIKQDIIDFKLRDIVTKETRVIRELIIAKAFAYYEIENNPSTEISDPVGFKPEEIK